MQQYESSYESFKYVKANKDMAIDTFFRTLYLSNFKMPLIPEEEWVNTINDVGIFAFIQGIPVGDQIYNNYAFGGGRLVKKSSIHGGVDPATGNKYYYQSRCTVPYQPAEIFDHKKDAARSGYFPAECVKQ